MYLSQLLGSIKTWISAKIKEQRTVQSEIKYNLGEIENGGQMLRY